MRIENGNRDGGANRRAEGCARLSESERRGVDFEPGNASRSRFGDRIVGITALTDEVGTIFKGFGTGDARDFARSPSSGAPGAVESGILLRCGTSSGESAYLWLSASTGRLIEYFALGYSLTLLHSDGVLRSELFENRRPLSGLEISLLLSEPGLLGSLVPTPEDWGELAGGFRVAGVGQGALSREFEGASAYWETRSFVLDGREYQWTVLYDHATLFGADLTLSKATGGAPSDTPDRTSSVLSDPARSESGSRYELIDAAYELGALGDQDENEDEHELRVVAARVETSDSEWRSLRPGDVIHTDVDASSLFEVLIDNRLAFLGRPGLRQGAPAVQLIKRAGEPEDE